MDTMRARKLALFRENVAALDTKRAELATWQTQSSSTLAAGFAEALDAFDGVAQSAAGARVAAKALGDLHARLVALALELGEPAPEPVDDPTAVVERSLSGNPRHAALFRAVVDGRLAALLDGGR